MHVWRTLAGALLLVGLAACGGPASGNGAPQESAAPPSGKAATPVSVGSLADVPRLSAEISERFQAAHYLQASQSAEQLVAILREALPADHPQIASGLTLLARLYVLQGRTVDALPLLHEALDSLRASGRDDGPPVAAVLTVWASLDLAEQRYGEAEVRYRQAEAILRPGLPATRLMLATSLFDLAGLHRIQGRYRDAEDRHAEALTLRRREPQADDLDIAASLNGLALALAAQNRNDEAEPAFNEAREIYRTRLPENHPSIASVLNNLGALYQAQGRFDEAEQVYADALEMRRALSEPGDEAVAQSLNNLASLYFDWRKFGEAERYYDNALSILRSLQPDTRPDIAATLNNLAELYRAQDRFTEAETHYRQALDIIRSAYRDGHPNIGKSTRNLAELFRDQGRPEDAEPLYREALAIFDATLSGGHPDRVRAIWNYFANRDAGPVEQPASQLALDLLNQDLNDLDRAYKDREVDPARLTDPSSAATQARRLLAALRAGLHADDLDFQMGPDKTDSRAAAFRLAQAFAGSDTAKALSIAIRDVGGLEGRAALKRYDEADLTIKTLETSLSAMRDSRNGHIREAEYEKVLERLLEQARADLNAAAEDLKEIDPDLAELGAPQAQGLAAVQEVLQPHEAVIVYSIASADDGLLAFVVTPGSAAAVPLGIDADDLATEVTALRAALTLPSNAGWLLQDFSFDVERAHGLYKTIVAPLVPFMDAASRLLIVPDGALRSLPLHVLPSDPGSSPRSGTWQRYAAVRWLADDYAISSLPAVSSIVKGRAEDARPASGDWPFLGFGDPALGDRPDAVPQTQEPGTDTDYRHLEGLGAASPTSLSGLKPVPQTRPLLEAVGAVLGAQPQDLFLGERAQEVDLYNLNDRDWLRRYRIIAFATHALIANELNDVDLIEPAIVLSPPRNTQPRSSNDGLLRASEVVDLALDADLVILAACNTAAPDGRPGAQTLSGLAKAFIYAQARRLLVSHWPAEAGATALLVPAMADLMAQGLAPAVALQQAMAEVRANPDRPELAHPALWAPFVIVGDGN